MVRKDVLYTIQFDGDHDNQIVIGASIVEIDGRPCLSFFDTNRGHRFEGSLIKDTKDGVIWQKEPTHTRVVLKAVTLDRWKSIDVWGKENLPKFQTKEELWEWYYKKFTQNAFVS